MKTLRWILPTLVLAVACASAPGRDERVDTQKPPFDDASFEAFNSYVGHQCATIDCHGSKYRNMRIYGALGLRLPGLTPGDTNADPSTDKTAHLQQTTTPERMESYLSITGLEPEILDAVVRDKGANADRLTFMRKAYGDESHKGYNLVARGSLGDKCLLSFFAGAIDVKSCQDALPDTLACLSPSDPCASSLR